MKTLGPLLLLLMCCSHVAAWQWRPEAEYYPYAEREERPGLLVTDSSLFFRAVQSSSDLYGRLSEFTLPQIAFRRRGMDYGLQRTSLSGVGIAFRYRTLLRLLGAEERHAMGLDVPADEQVSTAESRLFRFTDGDLLQPFRASVHCTDRNYRLGLKFSYSGPLRRGWYLSAAFDGRTGRDMHVEGVFTNAMSVGLRLHRRFAEGHGLSLLCIIPPSMRGTRLSSIEESFVLTGNRLYNPAWGWQQGKKRNSRIRRELLPLISVAYERPWGISTHFETSFTAETGYSKYSMLDWYDARTPMPDNYRYMPGYTADRESEEAWLSADPHYTQIDWDELIRQNRMAGGSARYALTDRVERLTDLNSDVRLSSRLNPCLTLYYGLSIRYARRRNYKEMRDLLGASYLVDIDHFLVDDDTYSNRLQNDLRHPDRIIREGDRMGYDYAFDRCRAAVYCTADYRTDRFRADLSVRWSGESVVRRGYYEKELYPESRSYGRSREIRLAPYALKCRVGWAFTPRHYLELAAAAFAHTPDEELFFFQPLYNNRVVDRPLCEHRYAAELNYRLTGPVVDFQASLYAVARYDGTDTEAYYDDLATTYCNMAVEGVGLLSYGLESAAAIRLSRRWLLTWTASAGYFGYIRDPILTILSDADNSMVDRRAVSRMGDCRIGNAPQITATCEVAWFGPRGWGWRTSAGYAGVRYVEPMFLRRTDRLVGQGGVTPELFDAFTCQERLPDAFTVDLSLFKSFYFNHSRLTAWLRIRNLSGERDTPYGGRESLRVQRLRVGDNLFYRPHATRYTYSLPRSFYLAVSYRF